MINSSSAFIEARRIINYNDTPALGEDYHGDEIASAANMYLEIINKYQNYLIP